MILALVVFGASINVSLTIPKHGVDDQGKLVRRRRDGLRRSKVRLLRRRNAPKALSERCSALAARRKAFAARFALGLVRELITLPPVTRLFGLSPSQDAKCCGAWPFAHVRSNLADHLERRVAVHAINSGQVHPRHPVQLGPHIKTRCVPLAPSPTGLRRRRLTDAAVVKPLQLGFNLPVALGDLALINPVKLQGLG